MSLPTITIKEFISIKDEIGDEDWYYRYYSRIFAHPKFEDTWKTLVFGRSISDLPDTPLTAVFVTTTYQFLQIMRMFEAFCDNNDRVFPIPGKGKQSSAFNATVTAALLTLKMKDMAEFLQQIERENPLLLKQVMSGIMAAIAAKELAEQLNVEPQRLLIRILQNAVFAYVLLETMWRQGK